MPDITNPNKPRPKKILFSDNSFSFISCEDSLASGEEIFDYTGGVFIPTPDGDYTLADTAQVITVNNGHITSIS